MFARQLIYLTRSLSLSRQPSINNKRILLGTVYSGNVHTKCYSMDHRDEPSSVKTGDNEHRRTEVIKLEMEILRNDGCNVPDADFIKAQHWSVLLTMNSRSARRKYYHFLYVTQKNIETQNIKKEQKSLAYAAFKEQQKNEGAPPPKSRFLLRIYDQTMNRWRNNRLFRAMQFSEKIIFDCSYDQYMNRREANSLADQLQTVFSVNRLNRDPYDVHFCNVNFDGTTFKRLTRLIPTLRNETFPLNLHETSYLDVFPKEKLIYLTPHCKTDLTDYDADKVYIVGAMVDTSNHEPLSMMKAKELGIAMAKLPLERYLDWGQGDKTLTLDQIMRIMLDWRATNSWERALQHIPKRKIMQKDVTRPMEIGKWNANLNKFKPNFFDNDPDSTGLSTAEKFKRQPATNSQWSNQFKPNYGNENNSFDNESDSTGLSTAEKFKRQPVTTSQWSNKFDETPRPNFVSDRVDVKKPERKQASGINLNIKKLFDD